MLNWEKYRRKFDWVNRLPAWMIVNVSTLGPIGRLGRAPGTNGSAMGMIYFFLVYPHAPPLVAAALLLASVYLAVAFCDAAEIRLGQSDPGYMILDEFVAMPFCFLGVFPEARAHGWPWWFPALFGFVLFRYLDIRKPFGIYSLQKLPGGLGVVADDLAAALATCVLLHLIV